MQIAPANCSVILCGDFVRSIDADNEFNLGLGRPKCLNAEQLDALCAMLLKGALAFGFPTEMWTIKRLRTLVKRELGVAYSHTGGWQLARLGLHTAAPGAPCHPARGGGNRAVEAQAAGRR